MLNVPSICPISPIGQIIEGQRLPLRIVLFYHSLVSDWNHGNAHFLRGVVWELQARGHQVRVYEPVDGWSRRNLLAEVGEEALEWFAAAYPGLPACVRLYEPATLDLEMALDGADLVLVHEWNEPELVRRIGDWRRAVPAYSDAARQGAPILLFHDTHHRAVTDPAAMERYDLRHYDGVLAFGRVLRDLYLANGWTLRSWTWHEAADTRVFYPICPIGQIVRGRRLPLCPIGQIVRGRRLPRGEEFHGEQRTGERPGGDLVWVGNSGDEERTAELKEFLLEPVQSLGLRAAAHGVRYPPKALAALRRSGITYNGWLANYAAPDVFAGYRVTVHVPRRPYARVLPGIPTIRVFEALACGIPLLCAPWEDAEGLFAPGEDYLPARSGAEMTRLLREVLADRDLASALATHGLETIQKRHTCAHRVDELLGIVDGLRATVA